MPPDANRELGHPDAAGWALGALDPEDAAAFQVHLRDCAECQSAVAEFESMARALKSPAPAVEPPPDLEAKVVASVQQAVLTARQAGKAPAIVRLRRATLAAKRGQRTPEPAPTRMSRWWHWHWNFPVFSLAAALGAAAAAVLAVVVVQPGHTAAPAVAGTVIPLQAQVASAGSGPAPSGQAIAQHSASGWQIQLTVKHLPALSAGQFYECWYAGPGNSPGHPDLITAGTFTVGRLGAASVTMWSAADPHQFRTMQITVQRPDDPGQPGPVILRGSPQPV
jgi:anti-sigma factor RsiW